MLTFDWRGAAADEVRRAGFCVRRSRHLVCAAGRNVLPGHVTARPASPIAASLQLTFPSTPPRFFEEAVIDPALVFFPSFSAASIETCASPPYDLANS